MALVPCFAHWFISYPALSSRVLDNFALELQCSLNLNSFILVCSHGLITVFLTALCTEILHKKMTSFGIHINVISEGEDTSYLILGYNL